MKRDGSVHSRRRLLGMGAGMTPLVLTLASRPALGNECTNSALLSGNNSTSTRRDPNYCYYQELDPISSAFVAEQQRITTELNAAWAAGDSTLAAQLQDEYYALVDDYNAQMAALKSKYSVYPGFSA
ncbi:MAG: hypothetical protein KDG54_16150 [Geminicoccaceae bacterium]|nr:hypothetical protein [Geminicoccaceae bacterium]